MPTSSGFAIERLRQSASARLCVVARHRVRSGAGPTTGTDGPSTTFPGERHIVVDDGATWPDWTRSFARPGGAKPAVWQSPAAWHDAQRAHSAPKAQQDTRSDERRR